jgi:hypothetical protein
MALKITFSSLAESRVLTVDDAGVRFQDGVVYRGTSRIAFRDILAIVLSPKGLLSIQVGDKVYKIQTKLGDRSHQQVIDALVRGAKASAGH